MLFLVRALGVGFVVLGVVTGGPRRAAAADETSAVERDADWKRIRAHLAGVEDLLRERDASSLPEEQRVARATHIRALHEYWVRGEFPRNTDHPGTCVPYFIDRGGRPCAVAHLVIRSGRHALANEVASNENNAYLGDMRTDGLLAWAATSGLTLEELALIQPEYCGCYQYDQQCVSCSGGDPWGTSSCEVDVHPDGEPCHPDWDFESEGSCEAGVCVRNEGSRCGQLCGVGTWQNGTCVPSNCDDGDARTDDFCDLDESKQFRCFHEPIEESEEAGCRHTPGSRSEGGRFSALLVLFGAVVLRARRRRCA